MTTFLELAQSLSTQTNQSALWCRCESPENYAIHWVSTYACMSHASSLHALSDIHSFTVAPRIAGLTCFLQNYAYFPLHLEAACTHVSPALACLAAYWSHWTGSHAFLRARRADWGSQSNPASPFTAPFSTPVEGKVSLRSSCCSASGGPCPAGTGSCPECFGGWQAR